MKYIQLVIFTHFAISGMAQNSAMMIKTFESENGFYRLQYPDNFNLTYEENILNIFPIDGQSALTISSYHFSDGIDDNNFEEMFKMLTENYEPTNDKVELNRNVWIQKFKEQSKFEDIMWIMCLNRNKNVLLVISINFKENEKEEIINQYQEIFNSIINLGVD